MHAWIIFSSPRPHVLTRRTLLSIDVITMSFLLAEIISRLLLLSRFREQPDHMNEHFQHISDDVVAAFFVYVLQCVRSYPFQRWFASRANSEYESIFQYEKKIVSSDHISCVQYSSYSCSLQMYLAKLWWAPKAKWKEREKEQKMRKQKHRPTNEIEDSGRSNKRREGESGKHIYNKEKRDYAAT